MAEKFKGIDKKSHKGNLILLRDHSDESRKAESVLEKYKVKHAQLFTEDRFGIPELFTPTVFYRGLSDIKWFASQYKTRRAG